MGNTCQTKSDNVDEAVSIGIETVSNLPLRLQSGPMLVKHVEAVLIAPNDLPKTNDRPVGLDSNIAAWRCDVTIARALHRFDRKESRLRQIR